MKNKRILSVVIAMCIVASFGAASAQGNETQVMVDGNVVNFASDLVKVDGRILAPASGLFLAMGATFVEPENEGPMTATIGEDSAQFTAESKTIKAKLGDVDKDIEIDAAPKYIDGVLYVPIRAAAEALGFSVSWDADANTAVIINIPKIVGELNKNYTIFNEMMTVTADPEKTYKVTGEYKQDMKVKEDAEEGKEGTEQSMSGGGKIEMLMKNVDMSMVYTMSYDMSKMLGDMPQESMAQMQPLIDSLKDAKIQLIYNSEDEVIYLNLGKLGEQINTMSGLPALASIKADTWIKLDLTDFIDKAGKYAEDLHKIAKGDFSSMTFGRVVEMCISHSDIYSVDSYKQIMFTLEVCKGLLSDKAFTKSGTSDLPVYKYSLNAAKISSALAEAKAKYPGALGMFEPLLVLPEGMKLDTVVEFAKTGKYDFTMKMSQQMSMNIDDSGTMSSSMEMECAVPGKTTMTQDSDIKDAGQQTESTMEMTMDTKYTDEKVLSAPPEKANIFDLGALIKSLFMSVA